MEEPELLDVDEHSDGTDPTTELSMVLQMERRSREEGEEGRSSRAPLPWSLGPACVPSLSPFLCLVQVVSRAPEAPLLDQLYPSLIQ